MVDDGAEVGGCPRDCCRPPWLGAQQHLHGLHDERFDPLAPRPRRHEQTPHKDLTVVREASYVKNLSPASFCALSIISWIVTALRIGTTLSSMPLTCLKGVISITAVFSNT
jgi:hypothetical protein